MEEQIRRSGDVEIGHMNLGSSLTGSIPNWVAFSKAITYTSNDPVDNYSISIALLNFTSDSTIYCHIDDLSFDVSTSVAETNSFSAALRAIEGTNQYLLSIAPSNMCNINIDIFDITGRRVKNVFEGKAFSGYQSFTIDISFLHSGIYFCRLNSGNSSQTLRLLKQ